MTLEMLENLRTISFLSYNIEGLLQKLSNNDFTCFINSIDIVCLVETFLNFDLKQVFNDFELFQAPARKLSWKGRCSGGVIVMVKKKLSK